MIDFSTSKFGLLEVNQFVSNSAIGKDSVAPNWYYDDSLMAFWNKGLHSVLEECLTFMTEQWYDMLIEY